MKKKREPEILVQYYKDRLWQLESWKKTAKTPELIKKYDFAISLSNNACQTFETLSDSAVFYSESFLSYFKTDQEVTNALIIKMIEKSNNSSNDIEFEQIESQSQRNIIKLNELNRIIIDKKNEVSVLSFNSYIYLLNSVNKYGIYLYSDIFNVSSKEIVLSALLHFVEITLSSIPGISSLNTIKRIIDDLNKEKEKGSQADKHLVYVDNYANSVYVWTFVANEIIKQLNELAKQCMEETRMVLIRSKR